MPISKNQLKLITSLQHKKYRQKEGLFVAEGVKVVNELLASNFVLEHLFCVDRFEKKVAERKCTIISQTELQKASFLKNANQVLALFKIKPTKQIIEKGLILVLDGVNDPGNLGTIIRLCDWFGVSQIVCSNETVDSYNPKVIQSSMASFSRVSIIYSDLSTFLSNTNVPIYATEMNGENVYQETFPENAILILGNEANGISDTILSFAFKSIAIPRYGDLQKTESLNVATATAILLNEFRRFNVQ